MGKASIEWDKETEKKLEEKFNEMNKCCGKGKWDKGTSAGGGAVYGLGLIGALFYYLGQGGTFGTILLGILKAIVWPAIFVFEIFKYLKL